MRRLNKVFLTGGDNRGWALDIDLRSYREILKNEVDLVDSFESADVIHTVNIESLLEDKILLKNLQNKQIVGNFTCLPSKIFELYPGSFQTCAHWYKIAQSHEALFELQQLGAEKIYYFPYPGEINEFSNLRLSQEERAILKDKYRIPQEKFLIGSFQRDSEGSNLQLPKLQKGPDLLLAILEILKINGFGSKIHLLIAGPRRHWLRSKLITLNIPFTFVGSKKEGDDYPENILSLTLLNTLTNLLDLYVVTSRWEGAPHAIFETILAETMILSSPVGVAPDILPSEMIYRDAIEAANKIETLLTNRKNSEAILNAKKNILNKHSTKNLKQNWKNFYCEDIKPLEKDKKDNIVKLKKKKFYWLFSRVKNKLFGPSLSFNRIRSVSIFAEIKSGAYGGGNQALKALAQGFKNEGIKVYFNSLKKTDAIILNSAFFNETIMKMSLKISGDIPVIHRVDGPIFLYRGTSNEQDYAIHRINKTYATATAFQSIYSWREMTKMFGSFDNPFLVRNPPDPKIFFEKKDPEKIQEQKKIKIISTSWSPNLRKGFEIYKDLDITLDFNIIEYTFVGNSPIKFNNIITIPPKNSIELSILLKKSDLYITASENDPASNSLSEAISCGLPVIYKKSGGHAEISQFRGLGFSHTEQIPTIISKIIQYKEAFHQIRPNLDLKKSVFAYLKIIHDHKN